MSRFQSEQERQEFRKQHIETLTADVNDPNLSATVRQRSAKMLKDSLENYQVEDLYAAAKQSPDPEISAGRDPLIKMFMRERADMLHQQKQPQTIGTPDDFFKWLLDKPRFK